MSEAGTNPRITIGSEFPRPVPIRDEAGHIGELSRTLEGSCCVLLYLPSGSDESAVKAIKFLAGVQISSEIKRLVVLPAATPGQVAARLSNLNLPLVVAQELVPDLSAWQKPVYFYVDKAWVIRGVFSGGKEKRELASTVNAHQKQIESLLNTPQTQSAPILIVPNVLSKTFCQRLIDYFEQQGGQPSGVLDLSGGTPSWRPDPTIKARRDLTLEDAGLIQLIEQAVARHVLGKIRQAFQYQVTHHEPFKLVCYDPSQGYFRSHRDNETRDTNYRRFAMTINLNTGHYEGGALYFPEYGSMSYRPETGAAIVFSCSLLHEASDVTAGHRYAVLGFFYNPKDGLSPVTPV